MCEALARSIREELAHPKEVQGQAGRGGGDALDEEIDAHRGFAAERCEFFTGRADELARIDDYLAAEEPGRLWSTARAASASRRSWPRRWAVPRATRMAHPS